MAKQDRLELTYTRLFLIELVAVLVDKGVLAKEEAFGLHDEVRSKLQEQGLL